MLPVSGGMVLRLATVSLRSSIASGYMTQAHNARSATMYTATRDMMLEKDQRDEVGADRTGADASGAGLGLTSTIGRYDASMVRLLVILLFCAWPNWT